MTPDYPAAHSMDTRWFAVDGAGHLAVFTSGEAGAVPMTACASENAHTVQRRLAEVMPPVSPILDVQGRFGPHMEGHALMGDRAYNADWPVILVLSSLAPVQEAIAAGRAFPVQATEGFAVLLPDLEQEELARYHQLPELRASFSLYMDDDLREVPSPARWGVYVYEHITENWISGPYGRTMLPGQPLHVDQLPSDVRALLAGSRLEAVRFPDALLVQPVEHAECQSWESAYLDVTFRHIRPIPGKEGEYVAVYSRMSSAGMPFEVEPPAEDT